ncbi:hypothetical protein [Candidatus Thiodictyon syntrophicum]|jgi:hypothetical protein|uniref:Uncharacterized protein n=1 Tax=Candidatus Thiodictyon syntrophicum TaxID=1166950 RepID=A0A2K8UHZ7_9GAMM|nr:hypothetical protein [Candidatus Thiodictyon syntrophicum]AUB85157.1 hypothetical protein THSYN_30010 [Candidatus Thiodictyon syntrophicum]
MTERRAYWECWHFEFRDSGTRSVCRHPAYKVPTPWVLAILRGEPCGGDNAPLWAARPALPEGAADHA